MTYYYSCNYNPVACDDTATTGYNASVTINVLANDYDPDCDRLSIYGTPTATHGTVTVNYDGTLTFVPEPGYSGPATIQYTVTDGRGGYDTATVSITVSEPPRDYIVEGTSGDDLIDYAYTGDPENDRIDHNDNATCTNDDVVQAGAGNDTILSGAGNDTVYAEDGNDVIDGGTGNDVLLGGNGDDTFIGGAGNDTFNGGAGLDIIDYSNSTSAVNVNLGTGALSGGDAGGDVIANGIDGIIGTSYNDTLVGFDQQGTGPADTFTNVFHGMAGDDSILGAGGDDSLYGGADNDTIFGGTGNDYIEGDGDLEAPVAGQDLTVDWQRFNNYCGSITNGSSYDMGGVRVTFGFSAQDYGATATSFTGAQYVESGDGLNGSGGLQLYGCGGEGGVDNTSTTTLSFGSTNTDYASAITDVSFRINDIDVGPSTDYHQDIVTIRAYDADGNLLNVTYTLEGGQTVSGSTISAHDLDNGGTLSPTSSLGSVLVQIDGVVARIEIDYDNGGYSDQAITLTDINGTTVPAHDAVEGDDLLDGGDGDDTILGQGGNDTLTGGTGADNLSGGDDRDVIRGGAGDTVDGGAGGDDYDTLDLTGQGAYRLTNLSADSNNNGQDGTVEFLDADGNVTGTLDFTEIENITGDDVNLNPHANTDTLTVNEDTSKSLNVLTNDTDPNGDTLTLTGATAEHGTVTINPDGTVNYTPDENYNGPDTITYTISDGNGGTATGTVNVTVTPVNDAPVANDDASATDYMTAVTVDVVANDTDVDGDTLTITSASSPDGTVSFDADGNITFTPAEGFSGDAVVTYTITDGNGGTDTATVTIAVGEAPLDGIVEGTAGGDLIDTNYTGDPEGDMVDHSDAILPGDAPEDDRIEAGAGNDTVYAGLGDDTVNGDTGADVLNGGDGDDSLIGGAGNDTLNGDAGNDTLQGNAGTDSLTGGAGNDLLDGGAENDTLAGGDGNDTLYGGDGADSMRGGPGDDLVDGGLGNDTIEGGSGNDTVLGGDGNDSINAGSGNDSVDGGTGDDLIDTRNGLQSPDLGYPGLYPADTNPTDDLDTVLGGDGNDTIFTGDDADSISGGAGHDVIDSGVDNDTVSGGAGDDLITSGEGSDVVDGGDGNDTIYGGLGPSYPDAINIPDSSDLVTNNGMDTIHGGLGDDVIYGEDDDDQLYGDTGNDYLDGGIDEDTIYGGIGNDTVVGGQGADVLSGGDDRDSFTVASAAAGIGDAVDGGEGGDDFDVLDLTGAGPVSIAYDPLNPENGTVSFLDTDGNVLGTLDFVNIENVIVDEGDGWVEGTDGDDLIDFNYTGDPEGDLIDHNDALLPGDAPQDDRVLAGDGNDTVYAGLGDDTVWGEGGNDVLRGEDGNDSLSGGEGNDTLYGGAGNDTLDAGQGEDVLRGGSGDDLLMGGPTSDTLDGGSGNDTLNGGNAADYIIGGSGNDSANGEAGNDYIDLSNGSYAPDRGYPGLFAGDTNPDDDHDTVYGGLGNDTILTGDDADYIDGGDGSDSIDAGCDDDTVIGGTGNDYIVGAEGSDSIDAGDGDDTVYAGLGPSYPDALNIPDATDLVPDNGMDTVHGGLGNDVIYGADDDDMLFGDEGNDYLDGGIDEDTIEGGTGNDTILGGQGADVLSGGDDRDTFTVPTAEAGIGDAIDGGEGGDDYDTLNLTGAGPLRVVYDSGNPENGIVNFLDGDGNITGSLTFQNIENVIPCFTPGTLVATPKGERLVEELREGDKVLTRDNGIQEIRWVGRRDMSRADLIAAPHLKPVLIKAGSLGNGLPERDMLVSPNHRMLVANERTALYFEEHEVLVAAKHLVDNRGVKTVEMLGTSYLHFMFDRHEVVLANGAWTESFQPGDQTLGGMGNAQRSEIFEIFPELQTRGGIDGYTAARKTLKKHEAALLRG